MPENTRIGFTEDLRDEALTALVFLFLLIPLGLRQVDLLYDVFEPSGAPDVLTWVGFFGAELTKSVPFVDWSEVFHVANGSPIKPRETSAFPALGAQLVFGLRAMLDLLLLAAVLQALSIAGRRRETEEAWEAGHLPLRDPFDERLVFDEAASTRLNWPGWREIDQPWVLNFPDYEAKRLEEIVRGPDRDSGRRPAQVFRSNEAQAAAMTVWAKRRGAEGVGALLEGARRAEGSGLRRHALELAVDVVPLKCAQALTDALADASPAVQLLAARRLGWLREERAAEALRARLGEGLPRLRKAAATALAKLKAISVAEARAVFAEAKDEAETAFRLAYIRSLLGEGDGPLIPETKDLPRGLFIMGDDAGDEDEKPAHPVTVQPFAIGVYQTTFAEYDAFCAATGRDEPPDEDWNRDRRPVINVSWEDAQAYVAWLSDVTGERWRLPTEAEWEYACRAGTTKQYSFGDDEAALGVHGWFGENSDYQTHPVGEKLANPWGLHDMHGNVFEWCQDAWNDSYQGAPADGAAWIVGDVSRAVLRGGSWSYSSLRLRAANRHRYPRVNRNNGVGFRVARTIIPS